jgi:hypothetical protein
MWLLAMLAVVAWAVVRGQRITRTRARSRDPYASVLAVALIACNSERDRSRVTRRVEAMRRSPDPDARDALLTVLWAIHRDVRNDLPLASRLLAAIESIERPRATEAARAYNDRVW